MNTPKLLAASLLAITLFASCSKQDQTQAVDTTQTVPGKDGQGLAIVRAVNIATKSITLNHNNIPGIMDAMTMEYPASDTAMLRQVHAGDSVSFVLHDDGRGYYLVTRITLLKKGNK